VLLSACADGLGRSAELLEPRMLTLVQIVSSLFSSISAHGHVLNTLQKFYTSNLLFVASLAFSRASVAYFLLRLTPVGGYRRFINGLLGAIAVWGMALIFAIALTCDMSSPWIVVGQRCTGYVGSLTKWLFQDNDADVGTTSVRSLAGVGSHRLPA